MARRRIGGVGVFLLVAVWAGPLWAGPLCDLGSDLVKNFKRRNCWPEPFVYADRQTAQEPLAAMVGNGWQRQNLVSDVHFENGGAQLNETGRRKVLAILNEAPEQHRIVYVYRGATPQETAVRMATVEQFVAQSAYGGQLAPVYESSRPDNGWPADQVEAVSRKFQASFPDPRLPSEGGGGSSSSSSSSSSSGTH
jgi:hypothetical protein